MSYKAVRQASRSKRNRPDVPASFYWWPITNAKIRKAAKQIADAVHPEKIILFGSFAYGKPTLDSDVDLLIIMETPNGEWALTEAIRDALPRRSYSVDLLVRSQAEIDRRIAADDWFLEEVVSKGTVLYERDDSRVGAQSRKRLRRRSSG